MGPKMQTPRAVDIAITHQCNLRCRYCSHFSGPGDSAQDLPLDRSVISRHLRVLESVGVVKSEKEGRHTYYEIDGAKLVSELERLTDVVKMIRPVCCP